jgi:putative membrane protein
MFYGCGNFGYGNLGYGRIGGGPFMMIIPLLLIGLIIYALFKGLNQTKGNSTGENSEALNILMERYALGEISEEEYLNKKKLLRR